ncbi:MAG: hypothetical protein GKR89_12170 [Candidatus Latescibacteria bacterium]|nr:hypothetical protein [Candidatus Latescibacterota bacterium]
MDMHKTPRRVTPVALSGLRSFFADLVRPAFASLGMGERLLMDYVVDLLARFTRADQLYRIRDQQGRALDTIAEMMLELSRQWDREVPYRFERDVDIRRHCGDYALFMSGLFRGYVESRSLLDYYLSQGRSAYDQVAELEQLAAAGQGALFRRMAVQFEHISGALDYMRKVHLPPHLGSGPYRNILPS